jgi:16S rRNA processing protein RimM
MAAGSSSRSTKSIERPTDRDDVVVGVVRAPHGIRGEVRVEPTTDRSAERFRAGSRLLSDGGPLTIASVRGTADAPIVRFEGVDGRNAAAALRDRELRVPRADARRAGEHLWDDLVGMSVATPEGLVIGEVREILRAGGTDVLVVRDGEREVLLPALESVIRDVDPVARRIVAVPQEEA